jgi:hypothetical protein
MGYIPVEVTLKRGKTFNETNMTKRKSTKVQPVFEQKEQEQSRSSQQSPQHQLLKKKNQTNYKSQDEVDKRCGKSGSKSPATNRADAE